MNTQIKFGNSGDLLLLTYTQFLQQCLNVINLRISIKTTRVFILIMKL